MEGRPKDLIEAQENYITFLGDCIGKLEVFNFARGMKPNEADVKKGEILRGYIEEFKNVPRKKCKCKGGATGRSVTHDFEHRVCDACGGIE